MQFRRLRLSLGALLALAIPTLSFAHTRWFAHVPLAPYIPNEPTGLYIALWSGICIAVLGVGLWLERERLLQLNFLKPRVGHAFERASSTFSMVAGAFLMIAGTHEYLFSPNLSVESGMPMFLVMAQFVLGLSFLLGVLARVSALLLIVLWSLGLMVAGFVPMLENLWVLSTAVFILIMGNDYFSIVSWKALGRVMKKYHDYALPLLRLGTGATLVILGFTEKILAPEFGMHFLSQYQWNFMQLLGLNFSDYLFTISAGFVEILFGLVFILGVVTRLNALVLAVFFTIPLFLLGPIELAGHVPHFAAVVLILLFGVGEHFKVVHPHPRRRS